MHYKKGWFFRKIFDNSHLKFEKVKKAKIKNSIFDSLLIVNETFSQMSDISWNFKTLAIKRWFPFNFAKVLEFRHFMVGGPKIFKFLQDISFDSDFPKLYCRVYCCFLCLLLSWSRWYSMKWISNFDGL